MSEAYDLIVIGAGAAGSTAAKIAARQQMRVALVEKDKLGGTCLNYGCDPTKFLLYAAQMVRRAATAERYGLRLCTEAADWTRVIQHVDALITRVRGGTHAQAVARQETRGIDVVQGAASFEGGHVVRIGERVLDGRRIVIAVGYDNVVPEIPGLRDAAWISNRQAVSLDRVPARLAIIGGGPVGVEFAQIFSRFGARVTLLESGPRILLHDDAECAALLERFLCDEGIRIECGVDIEEIVPVGEGSRLHWRRGGALDDVDVDCILVAAGRAPDLASLALEKAGVATRDGRLVVRDTLQTSVPHIWAAGDVTGEAPFTHVASAQAKHVVTNLNIESPERFNAHAIPWATYTYPALAHVGKTEEQLQESNTAYRVLRVDFHEITRNVLTDQEQGVYKLLVAEDGTIFGAHILANHADELIAPIVVAMRHGLDVRKVADTILPYPTMSEALTWAAAKFEGPKSIPSDVECSVRPCHDDDREATMPVSGLR